MAEKHATGSLICAWFQSFHDSLMFLKVHDLTSKADFQLLNQGELDVIGNPSLAGRICWHVFIRSLRNNNNGSRQINPCVPDLKVTGQGGAHSASPGCHRHEQTPLYSVGLALQAPPTEALQQRTIPKRRLPHADLNPVAAPSTFFHPFPPHPNKQPAPRILRRPQLRVADFTLHEATLAFAHRDNAEPTSSWGTSPSSA